MGVVQCNVKGWVVNASRSWKVAVVRNTK